MKKIKISIRLFIITIGMLLFIQLPTLAATGKSTGEVVRVRKSPSTESDIIELLAMDDVVEILGKEGDWYKVSFKGHTGYVSQSFISTNDDNVGISNTQNNENSNEQVSNGNNETNKEISNQVNNEVTNKENDNTEVNITVSQSNTSINKVYKMAETSEVNILPVVTSEYIGEIKQDENVTLISNAGLWVYVKSDNVSGWVRIDKLSTENIVVDNTANESSTSSEENGTNKSEESNNEVQTINYETKTMYTKVAAVNVRSQSNTTSDIVDSVGINTQVKVIGEANDWYKVEVNGRTGYIRKDLLSNEKSEITSRDNEFDRTAQSNVTVEVYTPAEDAGEVAYNEAPVENTVTEESVPVSASGVTGNDIVAYAQQFLGCSYVYGAAGPYSFDCSGLTMYVYQHFGYSLSHSSKVQATQGVAVTGELQPGDILVFSNDGRTVGHVGLYIGNDKFIHASDSTTGVIISNLSDRWNISKYWGARRIL